MAMVPGLSKYVSRSSGALKAKRQPFCLIEARNGQVEWFAASRVLLGEKSSEGSQDVIAGIIGKVILLHSRFSTLFHLEKVHG